jgi:hypothetical protein
MLQKWPSKVWYPWAKVKVGGGFFIPTLTPELFLIEALDGATRHGMKADGYVGVYNGQYGLVVIRTQ